MNIDLEFEKAKNRVYSFIHNRVIDELYKYELERVIAGENTILSHRIKHCGYEPIGFKIDGGLTGLTIEDELDYLRRGYSPEQIKRMWESAKPKLSAHGSDFNALIVTGTK